MALHPCFQPASPQFPIPTPLHLFEWWAFLITPFFSNSDTSKSIACICSVENICLCAGFSCTGSTATFLSTPSTIFRISSSIVICFHWAKQKQIWPALKSSDCFCNSSSTLGTLLQKSLTSFGWAFWFLAVNDFSPLNFPSPLWFQGFACPLRLL